MRNATGAMCETLTTPAIAELTGDDSAMSAPLALPFSLSYYGMTATHWSASTNGIAQLWPSAAGTPSAEYFNATIPDMTAPEGLVAPFWDDLYVETTSQVRTATLGTAPARRFVIEWNAVNTIGLESELTFQAKLFEGSNVIEFHYCAMTDLDSSDRHTGAEATIGAQNFNGSAGTEVAYNATGTVGTGVWIQLTPR